MTWAVPLAWLLAIGVLGPLAAHLLSRRTPTTRAFPTLRFVRATATSSRRLRTLHDPWLWLLRTAIVLLVAGAAAGPTLVTAWRQRHWTAPLQTAIVEAPRASLATDVEPLRDAADEPSSWHYQGRSMRQSLATALDDLRPLRSHRRLIVLRWSGDVRDLSPADVEYVPDDIGLRLEPDPGGAPPFVPAAPLEIAHAPDDGPAAAVIRERVPWHLGVPVTMVWPGAASRQQIVTNVRPATDGAADVLRRMQLDPRLQNATRRSRRDARTSADAEVSAGRLQPLAMDSAGDVLLWGGVVDDGLVLLLDGRPRDPVTLWAVRAAQDALRTATGWPRESRQWTAAELEVHQRPPGDALAPELPEGLDTRWWWLAALVLLLLEQHVRRRSRRTPEEADAGAGTEASHAA